MWEQKTSTTRASVVIEEYLFSTEADIPFASNNLDQYLYLQHPSGMESKSFASTMEVQNHAVRHS